ncbi:MAG TPA: methyltransferase domain-containing protein, partial [Phototrophicaceae bacterium]|nr:methyltransferase domain-containing protein [Phototrophicaceae bacterium]
MTEYQNAEAVKQSVRQSWDKTAAGWHKWMDVFAAWANPMSQIMFEMAHVSPGQRVLDVAAGDGQQAILAAEQMGKTGYVLSTDFSAEFADMAIQRVQAAGLTNVEVSTMDGENLKLEDNSFNTVLCRLGLMFFPNPQ